MKSTFDKRETAAKGEVTRRQMLMRLGLAAGAVYAAPVLLQLSEARASGTSGGSNSGPSGDRKRRRAQDASRSSFSGGRERKNAYENAPGPRRPQPVASFSR